MFVSWSHCELSILFWNFHHFLFGPSLIPVNFTHPNQPNCFHLCLPLLKQHVQHVHLARLLSFQKRCAMRHATLFFFSCFSWLLLGWTGLACLLTLPESTAGTVSLTLPLWFWNTLSGIPAFCLWPLSTVLFCYIGLGSWTVNSSDCVCSFLLFCGFCVRACLIPLSRPPSLFKLLLIHRLLQECSDSYSPVEKRKTSGFQLYMIISCSDNLITVVEKHCGSG